VDLQTRVVDAHLAGHLALPGALVQGLLNGYMQAYHWLEPLLGQYGSIQPAQTEEIAARSRELMDTHYNMPLSMFASTLGRSMKYSMALWETGARTLDEAQETMLDDLCAKANLRDGQRILDIGCGFGSLAAHALRRFPRARVYGLTLSQTQADYMRARQTETGHPLSTDRFYLIQEDFNEVRFDQPFDRVVSVGVFEHVSNLSRALEKVRSFLTDEGACFLHYIVYRPRPGETDAARQDQFMDRYVFPGGRIWSEMALAVHQRHLRIERAWFLNGSNYKRTLQAWLANYRANLETIRQESQLSPRQLRLWEFYLRACIAVFATAGGARYGNAQYLLRPA
jgi:cyclopropane-fatty-acyl-phospholipid synthase